MMLTDAGLTLLGADPLPQSTTVSTTPDKLPPSTRTDFIRGAGFTSDDTRSHLMGLGEYLAMYLFVWSDVLWLDPQSGMPVVPTVADVLGLITRPDQLAAARKLLPEMTVQFAALFVTYSTLAKVRRALANIATYMILDDHEITDDLNMQRRFCDRVYDRLLGDARRAERVHRVRAVPALGELSATVHRHRPRGPPPRHVRRGEPWLFRHRGQYRPPEDPRLASTCPAEQPHALRGLSR